MLDDGDGILYNKWNQFREGYQLRILFLINFAGKAGTEKYVENLVRIFSAADNDCRLAYNISGELSEKLAARGVPCFQIKLDGNPLAAAKQLAAYCREHEIEVIHAQYPRENIIALLSLRHYAAPKVVYTNHLTIRSGLKWRVLNRIFTPLDHKIIAVCREGRDIMVQNGVCPERIEVIYNGVEPEKAPVRDLSVRPELGVGEGEFMLTILARYAPEKGLFFLLDALAELKKLTDKPFRCVICGDGEQFDEVKQKAQALGLGETVIQTGFRRDAGRILRASDIYLNTSSCNEAMSFAILEAMNCALPLVVTDVGGNRDLAETNIPCGFVVQYGDVSDFASAILRLMEDEALYKQFSADALRKVSEEFDLEKLAWDVYRAYQ